MAFDTVANIVSDAATELGLGAVADVFGSSDPNVAQLRTFLKSLGRDLWREKSWTHLQQIHTFTSIQGKPRYDLPADFGRMIDQTGWNRTNRLPLAGPMSPQEWQFLRARLVGVVFTVLFRPMEGQIWLYPDVNTPGGYAIAFEYESRWWLKASALLTNNGAWAPSTVYANGVSVTNAGSIYTNNGASGTSDGSGPTVLSGTVLDGTVTWTYVSAAGSDAPVANTDVVQFDPQLVMYGLKLKWLKEKKFDTTSAQDDYDIALQRVIGDDSAAKVLSLSKKNWGEPMVSENNLPITGFGQ